MWATSMDLYRMEKFRSDKEYIVHNIFKMFVINEFDVNRQKREMPWPGIEPGTFRSSVWRSPNWAIPAIYFHFEIHSEESGENFSGKRLRVTEIANGARRSRWYTNTVDTSLIGTATASLIVATDRMGRWTAGELVVHTAAVTGQKKAERIA